MKIKERSALYNFLYNTKINVKKFKNSKFFIIVILILKIIAMGTFSSDYQNNIFMKFIYGFINEIKNGKFVNPYFIFRNEITLFPYPPVMFLIEIVGGFFSSLFSNIFLKNLLFKFPNLFFDLLGLYFLMKMFPNKKKYIGVFYFASPIIIYSIYMHGQLDIIPTVLLLGSLYYLTVKRNHNLFIIFLVCSVSTKLHILAVLPILFIYLLKNDNMYTAIKEIGITLLTAVMIIIPFFDKTGGFLNMVLLNKEQMSVTRMFLSYNQVKVYLSIFSIMLVYLKAFSINKINKSLLYSFCGVIFSLFLIFVVPMPGWYVWIIPFITIFFININLDKYINMIIYLLLNLFYLIYFIFIHKTKYVDLYFLNINMNFLKYDHEIFSNFIFTILIALLTYTTYMMFQLGIANNLIYKRKNIPFTIGISGDSGSGKTTLTRMIKNIFGGKNILFLEGDADHKWERGDENWQYFTSLNPKSNYLYKQSGDLLKLRKGKNVYRSIYMHDTGKFSQKYEMKSKPYIVLCGLHSLYLPQTRRNLDLKIYMDVEEKLRRYWKIQRDVHIRGYELQKVLDMIKFRMKDAEKYVYPQKKFADLIVKYYDKTLENYLVGNHDVKLNMELTLNADIILEKLRKFLEIEGIEIEHDYDETLEKQIITFSGVALNSVDINFEELIEEIIPNSDELLKHSMIYQNNVQGIMEVVILLMISYKMREGDTD